MEDGQEAKQKASGLVQAKIGRAGEGWMKDINSKNRSAVVKFWKHLNALDKIQDPKQQVLHSVKMFGNKSLGVSCSSERCNLQNTKKSKEITKTCGKKKFPRYTQSRYHSFFGLFSGSLTSTSL